MIAEEQKDQVDRATVEKNPPPIDVNVIVNEAPEKQKLQKPIVEEPKKEPVVSENLESKKQSYQSICRKSSSKSWLDWKLKQEYRSFIEADQTEQYDRGCAVSKGTEGGFS